MKLVDNGSDYPGFRDFMSVYVGVLPFDENVARRYYINTDIKLGLSVVLNARHFEAETFISGIPYFVNQATPTSPYQIEVNVPAGYVCDYVIQGLKAHSLVETNLNPEVSGGAENTFDVSRMHNHNGINSPKLGLEALSIFQNVPLNSFPASDGNGFFPIWIGISDELPGDFEITEPDEGETVNILDDVTFTWTASAGVVSYNIIIYATASGETAFEDTGVVSGVKVPKESFEDSGDYIVYVTAVNAAGTKTAKPVQFLTSL